MRRSPGWHCSSAHMAASVVKRMARAFPVLRIDALASVSPIRSANSVRVMPRAWSNSSRCTEIEMVSLCGGMSDREAVLFAKVYPSAPNLRQGLECDGDVDGPERECCHGVLEGKIGLDSHGHHPSRRRKDEVGGGE